MSDFNGATLNQLRLDLLQLCGRCGRIHGDVVLQPPEAVSAPRRQCCDCEPPETTSQWPGYEFPEAVALCRCCGCRPVVSGRQWSVWFCDACRRAVDRINQAGRCHVIPVGRHTLLDQIGRNEDEVDQETPPFVAALGDWFARVERLEMHARLVVQGNLRALSLNRQSDLLLVDYLARLPATAEFQRLAVRELGRSFALPPSLVAEATTAIS